MAILSSLLSVSEPSGFWITIIKAFEAVTNNYVLAIIFLTVVIRLIWSIVDLASKYNSQQMSIVNAKMQPEIDKVKAKYANQPQVLQQKENEIRKKYSGKTMASSCIIMLVTMVLNIVIFFTLFAGLNSMSSYKNSVSYDSIKYTYANCLNVTDAYLTDDSTNLTYDEKVGYFGDYDNLSFVIRNEKVVGEDNKETTKKVIDLVYTQEDKTTVTLYTTDYKTDFSSKVTVPSEEPEGEPTEKTITTNENLITLIQKYIPVYEEGEEEGSKEVVVKTITSTDKEGNEVVENVYLSTAIQNVAMKNVIEVYDETKESFLWIENIWIADSPMNKSIVSYDTLESQIGKKNLEEGEETIYNAFMPDLKEARNKTNGYLIVPILLVALSIASTFLTKAYNNHKNKKKGLPAQQQKFNWSSLIIAVIFGLFALFYNSVFAIYMLTGQLVSTILLVPQLMLVDWIIDKRNKKKEDKNTITVDYSRKF